MNFKVVNILDKESNNAKRKSLKAIFLSSNNMNSKAGTEDFNKYYSLIFKNINL